MMADLACVKAGGGGGVEGRAAKFLGGEAR